MYFINSITEYLIRKISNYNLICDKDIISVMIIEKLFLLTSNIHVVH